jgi:hypothetical protein
MHPGAGPAKFDDPGRLADAIVEKVGRSIVLALPVGFGKANHIVNALYAKAVNDRSIRLTIFTGLTLEAPRAKGELERRFLEPVVQRVFAGYPALDYAAAIHKAQVPPNVTINEFFFEAGQWAGSPTPNNTIFLRTTPMRCNMCLTGASMSLANWLSMSETQIRTYWWCSRPKSGTGTMRPALRTARGIGASFCSDRCVRTSL